MAREEKSTGLEIDPIHSTVDIYGDDKHLTLDVWRDKYRYGDEEHPFDSMRRVVEGVYAKDDSKSAKREALEAMRKGLWIPAGRIQAGAGTPNIVTLLNCYMCRDIEDSMTGIADALRDAMLTMQQGGGIGMNFSTLRPAGAYLRRTGAVASGPLPFMDMWDSMCATIMSAGSRRGAMMAVMHCEHPDLIDFITAKHEKGRLTNFNVSVLVTDAFMDAVEQDEDWFLGFNVPRADGKHLFVVDRDDGPEIESWYAYSKWRARDLWDLILENTYEWSEPGVIFIDRINARNNLGYCETITGTNPCGEQPLPPNGCCNLGAINLARVVKNPFTPHAEIDYPLVRRIAAIGTRFLDNVIDTTFYPLDEQAREEFAKRRIGIGITGLGNMLAQLELVYGSDEAIEVTGYVMQTIADATYLASAHLARERGVFPLYSRNQWSECAHIFDQLTSSTQSFVREYGIRNGVLLTIAPTGTTSLYAGNISSGLEPTFLHKVQRNVRQRDNTYRPYTAFDYAYLLYCEVHRLDPERSHKLPPYMVDHADLTVSDHLRTQAVCQQYVDASISKTINCPQGISFEDFKEVYERAYDMGCKGCTTYRYSEVRGSILASTNEGAKEEALPVTRPDVLAGHTYKIKWPSVDENYYITINDVGGKPFEVFIQSTSSKYSDWTTALGLMISAIMRKGGAIDFIPQELMKVRSTDDVGYVDGRWYGSLVALIGDTIGRHLSDVDNSEVESKASEAPKNPKVKIEMKMRQQGDTCPRCNAPTLIAQEGCDQCMNCGYSNCG